MQVKVKVLVLSPVWLYYPVDYNYTSQQKNRDNT